MHGADSIAQYHCLENDCMPNVYSVGPNEPNANAVQRQNDFSIKNSTNILLLQAAKPNTVTVFQPAATYKSRLLRAPQARGRQ